MILLRIWVLFIWDFSVLEGISQVYEHLKKLERETTQIPTNTLKFPEYNTQILNDIRV